MVRTVYFARFLMRYQCNDGTSFSGDAGGAPRNRCFASRRLISFVGCLPFALMSWACNVPSPMPGIASAGIDAARPGPGGVDLLSVDAREVDLVEDVLHHRKRYHESLDRLYAYYTEQGIASKQSWAAMEREGLRRTQTFRYLMDAEVPTRSLHATDVIAEADDLYDRGKELMRRGGHGVPALYRRDLMLEAASTFRELIERYPSSDKIDDAAFQCGEIHKEYLPGQDLIAANWYERAWLWDPHTPHPARYKAAVVYDFRLHDRDRALELYNAVINNPSAEAGNIRYASRRIKELSGIASARSGSSGD